MNENNHLNDYESSENSRHRPNKNILVPDPFRMSVEPLETDSETGFDEGGYHGRETSAPPKNFLHTFAVAVRKHWFLILMLNLLVTAAALVYIAQKPDFYTATARIQVNEETNPADNSQHGEKSVIVSNPTYDPVYFTTQLQILEGGGLLRRVAKTLDLENNRTFLNPQQDRKLTVAQNVEKMLGWYHPPAPAALPDNDLKKLSKLNLNTDKNLNDDAETEKYLPFVGRIKKNLTVMPVRDTRMGARETRLIEIQYTHEDPQIAAKIVNSIGEAYVLQNLELKVNTNASASDFLQKRVADLQSEIRQGEERLINYSKSNQVVPLEPSQNTVVQKFGDLNLKLGQAENDRIAAESQYQAAMQNQMRAPTAERADGQVVGLESKLNELRQKLAQLKTQYTDEWYEVVETKKQIESVETQLNNLRKRASDIQIAGLSEKLNDARKREHELRASFEHQRADVLRQNEAGINFKIIQQEIDTNKTLLDGLLQRSREIDVIANGTPNNVLVAERAVVPQSPAGPERSKSVLLAFLLSLLAGGGIAFLIEWLNDTVVNADNLESSLGMPLLAVIPEAMSNLTKRLSPSRLAITRHGKRSRKHHDLEAFERPEVAEAFLQLRTNLTFSTAGGAPKAILVASGEESEGKTMTAVNLANCLAKTGASVLLIDADLRCPRLHLIKELPNKVGLTALLMIEKDNDEAITKAIQKNGCGNLHVLTAGERSVNPANLLSSEEMKSLIKNLSARFSHIIIDSPPALYFADSAILSTLADGVVLVVREGRSSRQSVLKARKIFSNVGANLIGMVVNGAALSRSSYNNYRYYEAEANPVAENPFHLIDLN